MFTVLNRVGLVDPWPEVVGVSPEGCVYNEKVALCVKEKNSPEGHLQLLQELVHAREEGLGGVGCGLHAGAALKHDHPVQMVCVKSYEVWLSDIKCVGKEFQESGVLLCVGYL